MYQLLHYNCFEVHKVSPDKVRQCFRENEVNFVIKFLRSADIIIIIYYNFETVEFALSSNGDVGNTPFATLLNTSDNIRNEIIALRQSTGRENIDKVISWLDANNLYDAPASVGNHNNVRDGLAKHSLEVYLEAMRLDEEYRLPAVGVTLCAMFTTYAKATNSTLMRMVLPKKAKRR